ncbi:DUF4238 domain-containing protein [Mucilaginibacter psychrotolerans]|uniref:DUF4238 domain-containing protein n=1 Tax=Mucilaginibacter psychrotolerans TaxID=1524096 RepID=A0A4Y8SGX8_9SPHI|nr:DUF4238 domain-containing protein [Mucilaginibacter psychrotolerans]TFF37714.1 DUF4238 domain-containing protein [Mucilaginibacter psychrotolerans]
MGRSVAHHYLPQFYLKGFTDVAGLFLIYQIRRGAFKMNGKRFSPASHFFVPKDNTVIFGGVEDNFIEESYSRMESKTAKVFDKIRAVNEGYDLAETDIPMLQYFAAELFWRLPAQQPVLAKMAETPSLKQLGISLKNKDTGETVDHPEIEQRILQHPNYTKLLRTMMPLMTYPRLFDCKSPVTIFTFPKGLPAICSDNPLILRHPEKLDLYQDDFILPLTENKILIRIKKLKPRFWSTVKIDIDMLVLLQSNEYACCTDERYPAMLKDLFQKKYQSTDRLRAGIFESIDDEFSLEQS